MENLKQGIIDYLKLPKTEYAIQINGPWGSGKTFYVKNNLFNAIHELYEGKKERYKICYLSLNGVSQVDEIGERVFFEIAGANNKLGVQGIKMLANYGPGFTFALGPYQGIADKAIKDTAKKIVEGLKKANKKNTEEIIIFIDDLERKSEKITIAEVLGYIHTNYLENQIAKVIFITNENEISEEGYFKLKEKIIDKNLFFEHDSYKVVKEIIYNTFKEDKDFIDFIQENEKDIFEAITIIFSNLNLRTIRYAFDNFNIVFNRTKRIIVKENHFSHVIKFLLLNILIVSKEYKEGNIDADTTLSTLYGYNIYYNKHIKIDNPYIKELIGKYFDKSRFIDEYKYFFKAITNLVIHGYLSNKEFEVEILEFLEFKRKNIHSKYELEPIQIITNYKYYNEDKVKKAQKDIEGSILNNEYNATEYPQLYQEFLNMKNLDLIFLKSDIEQLFRQGFYRSLENWQPKENEMISGRDSSQNQLIQEMIEKLKAQINKYQNMGSKKIVEEWLRKILEEENDEELFGKVENEIELFKILNETNAIEKYIAKNNKVSIRLTTMFYHKYLKNPEKISCSVSEMKHLDLLIEQLQKIYETKEIDKIHIHNINELVQEMEKIKRHQSEFNKGSNQ